MDWISVVVLTTEVVESGTTSWNCAKVLEALETCSWFLPFPNPQLSAVEAIVPA
jgi:hypothetical protein